MPTGRRKYDMMYLARTIMGICTTMPRKNQGRNVLNATEKTSLRRAEWHNVVAVVVHRLTKVGQHKQPLSTATESAALPRLSSPKYS
jgi:hypothetical protein